MKLSYKKSFLIRCENLGLLLTKLTANYESSRSNTDKLPFPVQMQLSEKQIIFSGFLIAFLESALNFEHFERKKQPHGSSISDVNDSRRRVYLNPQKVLFVKTLWQ